MLEPSGAVRLRIGAIGDIGLVGGARERARARGYAALLAPVADVLRAVDVGFANLEFPVAEPGWLRRGRTAGFWHEAAVVEGLAAAGVRVVSLGNNHVMDASEPGLRATLDACRAAGLATVGAGMSLAAACEPARLEVRGLRVVVLGRGAAAESDRARDGRAGVAPLDADAMCADLGRWRAEADVLVASVHWGSMYVEHPPLRVVEMARALAAAGADLVLGHHPHVLQGVRRQGHSLTLFSLGDAAFNCRSGELDIEWTRALRRQSAVFVAHVAEAPGLDVHPLVLDDDGVPRAAGADEAAAIRTRLEALSADWEGVEERFRTEAAPSLVRYELRALGEYLRRGRIDRALRLLASVRPRHLAALWNGLRGLLR